VRHRTIAPLLVLFVTCVVPGLTSTPRWSFVWAIGAMSIVAIDYSGRPPRTRTPFVLLAGGWWVASLMLVSLAERTGRGVTDAAFVSAVYPLGVAVPGGILAVGALWRRHRRSSLTDALLHLADVAQSTPRARRAVRDGLAAALGDPQVEVFFATGSSGPGWIDELGRPAAVRDATGRRRSTAVTIDDQDVALIVHDAELADDPRLVESIRAATTLAATNVRLRAQLVAEVDQLTNSRIRMASAAEEARETLAARIRAGAAAHLSRVDELLAPIGQLDDADGASATERRAQLAEARRELVSLAAGLGPAALVELGLDRAIVALALGLIPVRATVADIPDELVATVYLVCAECVSNVLKHANASQLRIEISSSAVSVTAVVTDDGCGGAAPDDGSGLRGVIDRVERLGGTVGIRSGRGGTQVTAVIPISR
jgi:signal transduction histidine kinase